MLFVCYLGKLKYHSKGLKWSSSLSDPSHAANHGDVDITDGYPHPASDMSVWADLLVQDLHSGIHEYSSSMGVESSQSPSVGRSAINAIGSPAAMLLLIHIYIYIYMCVCVYLCAPYSYFYSCDGLIFIDLLFIHMCLCLTVHACVYVPYICLYVYVFVCMSYNFLCVCMYLETLERLSAVMHALRCAIGLDQLSSTHLSLASSSSRKRGSAAAAANNAKGKSIASLSAFSLHLPSLVTALRTVFQRIVPSIYSELQASNHAASQLQLQASNHRHDEATEFVSSAALAVLRGSLLLLGAVASTNTGATYTCAHIHVYIQT